jgi:hypothetical protein
MFRRSSERSGCDETQGSSLPSCGKALPNPRHGSARRPGDEYQTMRFRPANDRLGRVAIVRSFTGPAGKR